MATNKWDVEGALNEVVLAIQNGSSLSIEKVVTDGYKERYREDFVGRWNADPERSWPDARANILPLAKLVGSLATTLALLKKGSLPKTVDPSSAYMAGYLVAKVICFSPSALAGVWCMNYYYMKGNPGGLDLIEKKFGEFLEEVKKIAT